MQTIIVTNLFTKLIASSLLRFAIMSLNTGINVAEITPPMTTSNSVVGIVEAVRNASDSIPAPKNAVRSESRAKPKTLLKSVAATMNTAVVSIF